MTLKFEAKGSVAVEPRYGVEIRRPRIEPGTTPDEVGYEYYFLIRGELDGLGFFGTYARRDDQGVMVGVWELYLAPDRVLERIIGLQRKIGDVDTPWCFLCAFAKGLITVFESGIFNYENSRYIVLADADALSRQGINFPASAVRANDGRVILAELDVPYEEEASSGAQP